MDYTNEMTHSVIVFASGLAVGAVLGAVSAYIFFKQKKEKELDKAIEQCNLEVKKLQNEVKNTEKELNEAHEALEVDNVMKVYGSDLALTKEQYHKLYSGESYDETKIHPDRASSDPADFTHPEDDEPEETDEIEDTMTESDIVDPREEEIKEANRYAKERRKPKMISSDVFEYEGRGVYDKCDLYYYVHDDTLATEEEEMIDDVERVVGDALDKYGFRENDEDEIYVRNFSEMTDYRITKMFSSFSGLEQ